MRVLSELRVHAAGLLAVAVASTAFGQPIPQEEYIHYMPLERMSIKPQTQASETLKIFGDENSPEYQDVDPRDGIDDKRGERFLDLAVQFAPLMVLNTNNFPTDHRWYFNQEDPYPLIIDKWDISGQAPQLVQSDSLQWQDLGRPCSLPDSADCRFLDVWARNKPVDSKPYASPIYAADEKFLEVLYVDFPGEDESTWKEHYKQDLLNPAAEAGMPLQYVHPFAVEVPGRPGAYELVLQYWFFYPYNDGGNNHEGDWEHLNVVLTPFSLLEDWLTQDQLNAVLDGAWDPGDSLVMKRVEHYFHHKVMTFDFAKHDAYQDRRSWDAYVDQLKTPEARELSKRIRRLAFKDSEETTFNTHPVVFIGADNKGFDQVLTTPGGKNRDSHGSYPFQGMFKDIGPAGATEEIQWDFDHQEWYAKNGNKETFDPRRGGVLPFKSPERFLIVPDWERVLPLVDSEPEARKEWGWLVLPMRWGYPASKSPFAGVVEHAETGNLAVPGPAYNGGWNRLGATPGFSEYDPNIMLSLFPLGVQDNFENNLGFLNLTYPTWLSFPPLDFAWRVLSAPMRLLLKDEGPVFYPAEKTPFRFVGISFGGGYQSVPEEFTSLFANEEQFNEFVGRLFGHISMGDTNTVVDEGFDQSISGREVVSFQLVFFVGDRFSTENTINHTRASISQTATFSNIDPFTLSYDLNIWDYQGTFRYALSAASVAPYIKAGYGLSWYRLEGMETNNEPFIEPRSPWVYRLNLSGGGGLEWIVSRSRDRNILRGLDFAIRGEYQVLMHKLGLDEDKVPLETLIPLGFDASTIPRNSTVFRHQVLVRAVVSW